jgi:hypothetical protein
LYSSFSGYQSGSNFNFDAPGIGNYEFASTFMIPLNSTITFGEGQYVFEGSPAIAAVAPPVNQTITWSTTPSPSLTYGGTYTPIATSTSGLPVSIGLDGASSGCSMSGGVVKLASSGSGTCLVDANQLAVGSTSFNPADQLQQLIPVPASGKTTQTVTFSTTKPSPATIGTTYNVTAATTLPTVTSATTAICTVGGSPTVVVTFKAAGECLIDANGSGNGTTLQAPEAQQSIVVSPGTGAPTSIAGSDVEFYIPSGSVDFGPNTAVELTPLLDGLTIWDATSNPATSVDINNVADNRNTYGGIYIHGGNVNVTSTSLSGTMSVLFVVANTLNFVGPMPTTLNVTGP